MEVYVEVCVKVTSHTTHGAHTCTQGVGLAEYQRYRYSLTEVTHGAGARRYRARQVPPVLGALRYRLP